MNEIRLACWTCDTDDGDGLTSAQALEKGWTDVVEAEVFTESTWWTHLGYCPFCPGPNVVQAGTEGPGTNP